MLSAYPYALKTGSGWIFITLLLDKVTAIIEYESAGMGGGIERYRFYWRHSPISDNYGLLHLLSAKPFDKQLFNKVVPQDLPELQIDEDTRTFASIAMQRHEYAGFGAPSRDNRERAADGLDRVLFVVLVP